MPRRTKTKSKTKTKQKVIVKNVIHINSHNKRKGISKPSFAQLSQQPRSSGSTVVSHFVQQPSSAYHPQPQSQNDNTLLKAMEKYENLVNKYAEREAGLINDNLSRIRANLSAPKSSTPLQDASIGRRLTFDDPKGTPNSPIIEKGGGGGFMSKLRTPITSMLGGRKQEEAGVPKGNSLSPLARAGLSEAQVRRELEEMGSAEEGGKHIGKGFIRKIYGTIGATAPSGPNMLTSTMINDLLANRREGLATHWTAIKDIPNQRFIFDELEDGGGKATPPRKKGGLKRP